MLRVPTSQPRCKCILRVAGDGMHVAVDMMFRLMVFSAFQTGSEVTSPFPQASPGVSSPECHGVVGGRRTANITNTLELRRNRREEKSCAAPMLHTAKVNGTCIRSGVSSRVQQSVEEPLELTSRRTLMNMVGHAALRATAPLEAGRAAVRLPVLPRRFWFRALRPPQLACPMAMRSLEQPSSLKAKKKLVAPGERPGGSQQELLSHVRQRK